MNLEQKTTLSNADVINMYIASIEAERDVNTPATGDILIYTDCAGTYYEHAHIESIHNGIATICEVPFIPYVSKITGGPIHFCTSGGTWKDLSINKFKFVGTRKKTFKLSSGINDVFQNDTITFDATVNVWEYAEKQDFPFTTKTHNRTYINRTRNINYKYQSFLDSIAWETDLDLQAWLHTFRGQLYGNSTGSVVAWTWKEIQHQISPEEFEQLEGIDDTMLFNGVRKCKRVYDEENSIVHTYFVWYWDDESIPDTYERAALQNKIRDELYLLPHSKAYIHAIEGITDNTIKPVSLKLFTKKR